MSGYSDIEWCDATWNFLRGCVKVSPGCKNCYAETFAERFRGVPGHPYELGFDPRIVPEALALPLRWQKPRLIFVNSMSDTFGEFAPFDYIAAGFGVMTATVKRHTYQVLTKRAERMRQWYDEMARESALSYCVGEAARRIGPWKPLHRGDLSWPLPNVHVGVSVEDKKHGVPRIAELRQTPAALRFLSVEPLLEDLGELDLSGIDWLIVGGESGYRARRFDLTLARKLRDQCREQHVPFFFKQAGAKPVLTEPGGELVELRFKAKKGNDLEELPEDLRIREMPTQRGAAA